MSCQAFTALERKIEAMNDLPEATSGLLPPISVETMDWGAFHANTGVSQRIITYCKMHFRMMRAKSMRHLVYMIAQFFQKAQVCDLDSVWAHIGKLLNKTGPLVRVMYENYAKWLGGGVKAHGRPRLLSEEQVQAIVQQVNLTSPRNIP